MIAFYDISVKSLVKMLLLLIHAVFIMIRHENETIKKYTFLNLDLNINKYLFHEIYTKNCFRTFIVQCEIMTGKYRQYNLSSFLPPIEQAL